MNELTEKLLAEGYTKDNHPESVQWSGFGHFEYTFKHLRSLIWESPCGLLNRADTMGSMGYMGIHFSYENDNPVFPCPLRKRGCELNHEVLRDKQIGAVIECAFHLIDKPYDYENSVDKLWDEYEERKKQARIALYRRMRGYQQNIENYSYCNRFRWDDEKNKWYIRHDPWFCAHNKSCGQLNKICLITGREIDRGRKGNVFYDLKTTRIRREGGLFDGEKIVTFIKGKKVFDNPVPLAICEEYARCCQQDILDRERGNRHLEHYLHTGTIGPEIEILNVRAERRETRDLLHDLRDVQEGIEVVHAGDQIKKKAEAKRERKIKRQEAKKRKIERSNVEAFRRWLKGDSETLRQHAEREVAKRNIEIYEQTSLFGGPS